MPSLRAGKEKHYWCLAKGCCALSLTGPQEPAQSFSLRSSLQGQGHLQQRSSQIISHFPQIQRIRKGPWRSWCPNPSISLLEYLLEYLQRQEAHHFSGQ